MQCRLWRRLPATIGRRGNVDAKLLHGTLDMLILKALYPALQRLTNQGRVETTWGTSEKNQRARFYSLTRSGRKQLARVCAEENIARRELRHHSRNADRRLRRHRVVGRAAPS